MCHRTLCLLKKWWRWLVWFRNWLILPEVGVGEPDYTRTHWSKTRPCHSGHHIGVHCCTLSLCYQYRDHLIGQLTTILVSHPTYIASYEGEMLCWLVLAWGKLCLPPRQLLALTHTPPRPSMPTPNVPTRTKLLPCHFVYTIPANVRNLLRAANLSWWPNSITSTCTKDRAEQPVGKPWPMIEIWSQVYGNTLRIKVNL